MTTLVDPLVCLSSRESPEDGAPLCGTWLSEHCLGCGLCPGVHTDDCPGDRLPGMSEIRSPRCAYPHPWHGPDCTLPTTQEPTDGR